MRGPFSVLLHSPNLASKLLPMVPFNRDETIVEPAPRFAAILAAVREREGAYVWAAQVAAAQRAGVKQAMIDLLREKGDPSSLPADEADIVTYIRQLMRTNRTEPRSAGAVSLTGWGVGMARSVGRVTVGGLPGRVEGYGQVG